ncbi:MAG: hypothetical protein QM687_02280 [Ferruginibacter sp.]
MKEIIKLMELILHTTQWIKGELFEAKIILAFGLFTIVAGLLCWKIGTTPNAKALLVPLIVVGCIYTVMGGAMLFSNQKRSVELSLSYETNKAAFVQSEKKRVERFQYQYVVSKITATICFALTLLLFWFSKSPTWQGIGIGLSYFSLAALVVDYFSKERASIYYQEILAYLQ